MLCYVLSFLVAVIVECNGRPDGAPRSTCSTLTPVHGDIKAQRSFSPYSVSAIKNGNKVRVTISSNVGEEIGGFALQTRSSRDKNRMIEGRFSEKSGLSKAIDCFRGKHNTLTHVNSSPKREIVTDWIPSENLQEDVIFRAAVAKAYAVFWIEVDSPPIQMRSDAANTGRTQKQDISRGSSESMYYNCYVSKGCFGLPSGCIESRDCEVFLSWENINEENGISFKMSGFLEPETYMAMGISTDGFMGDDSVTECIREGSTVTARDSWNDRKTNIRTRELPRNGYDGSFTDGLTTCSFTEKYIKESNGRRFNLQNSTYYLLLAKGPVENNQLRYHNGRLSSQAAVNFTAFEAISAERVSDSIKIHGTFMITAWLGFVGLAILLARHFKNDFERHTICEVKIWFALHRGLMLSALVIIVVAFILIFVHRNGWNYETRNPHAILGCISTALGLFQPIMAAFRPSPDHSKRAVFNWIHWAIGNSAQLLAIVTMFFAVSLESSGLKESFYWTLSIFVILHLIFHFLFQMQAWSSSKKKNEMKMVDIGSARGSSNMQNNVHEKNLGDNVFRVLLLGSYVIFLVVIILVLYALIGVA